MVVVGVGVVVGGVGVGVSAAVVGGGVVIGGVVVCRCLCIAKNYMQQVVFS